MAPTSDRWRRIEALCHSALELDPVLRTAFLDHGCGGDADLRREVESLLAASPKGSEAQGESPTVALVAGARLGPYLIEGLIGQGGMGRVYKTRDTRLGRTVAIKTSSSRFNQRFEREARAVAALNHPHICHLYDVGPDYLVMEYIEGTPLVSNTNPSPLPLDQALKYAQQILDALDAAHRQGIVHRDLKPGNIMVSKQGIKLLDFGLAQMKPGNDDETAEQTVGVMGTPSYMAPEQWEGRQADARSDIYAFGCVFYEMLTGKRPTPNLGAASRATVARPFEEILRTCLEKDPDDRWQSARELKHVLHWAGEAKPEPIADRPRPASRVLLSLWTAAGLLAVALVAVFFLHFRETPPVAPALRAMIALPVGPTFAFFALSPDGRYLVMSEEKPNRQLWLRAMNAPQAQPIPFTEDGYQPFWSPDSRFIAFFAMGKLKKIAVSGGPAQPLCNVPSGRGGSWSRDNVIVFSPNNSGISIQRVSASGGIPVDVTRTKGNQRFPVFLPDGRHFLYLRRDTPAEVNGIYVSSLDGTENRRVLPDVSGMAFAPPAPGEHIGHVLFVRDNTLMAAPFEPVSAQITGEVFPVAPDVSLHSPNSYLPVSISDTGMLVYETGEAGGETSQLAWYDRTGKPLGLVGDPGRVSNPALSPDGKSVAFQRATSSGGDLWVRDLERGGETRLTSDPSSNVSPLWSPNGDRVVFASNRSGVYNLYQTSPGAGGQAVRLLSNSVTDVPAQWSRDGRFVVYFELDPKNKRDLWALPLEGAPGDRKPIPFARSEFDELHGQLSPDGHWMSFTSDQSGRREVYVRPFPPAEGEWTISTAGGEEARWSGEGKELFFVAADGKMMAVPVRKAVSGARPSLELGAPVALFDAHVARDSDERYFEYDVTADGRRFLVSTTGSAGGASTPTLVVVTNWLSAVRK